MLWLLIHLLLSIIFLIISLSTISLLTLFLYFILSSFPTHFFIFKTLVVIVVIVDFVSIKISILFFVIIFIWNLLLDFFYFFLHFDLYVSCFEVFHQAFQFISFDTHKLNCFFLLHKSDFHVKLLIICSQPTKLNFSYFLTFEVDDRLGDENHGFF